MKSIFMIRQYEFSGRDTVYIYIIYIVIYTCRLWFRYQKAQ